MDNIQLCNKFYSRDVDDFASSLEEFVASTSESLLGLIALIDFQAKDALSIRGGLIKKRERRTSHLSTEYLINLIDICNSLRKEFSEENSGIFSREAIADALITFMR